MQIYIILQVKKITTGFNCFSDIKHRTTQLCIVLFYICILSHFPIMHDKGYMS